MQISCRVVAEISLLCAYRYGVNEKYAEREWSAGRGANVVIVGRDQRTPVGTRSSIDE